MINLFSLYQNLFGTKEISDDNLKKFVQDHLQRMVANNGGGVFTDRITETTLAYTGYFGNITDKDTALAMQQALTLTADTIIAGFKSSVSQKEGLVRSTYGKDSPTYQEFFPHGVTEYTHATKANIETLMNRMATGATAHVADLGVPFKTLFADYKTNYTTARNAQLAQMGHVSTERTETHATRDVIEMQLCKNLHFIGFTFPADADRCMDFFDQSIIRPSQSSDSDGIGRAAGIISDGVSGLPIYNAVVDYTDVAVNSRKSQVDGAYRSANVPVGTHHIKVVHPGHTPFEADINIVDEGDTPLNISLIPE
jgi:hypothetical protein